MDKNPRSALLSIARAEWIIARRNMWVSIAVGLMVLFSVVLATAGSTTAEPLSVDPLIATAASLTTLSVYLVPLISLLLSFDAIAGERERGTLALLLSYPIRRVDLLAGKCVAHLSILTLASGAGLTASGLIAAWNGGASAAGVIVLLYLYGSSVVLGATFLGVGYLISCLARQASVAAGLTIGVWMIVVILYDLVLLGVLVSDDGGTFTQDVFPWLLVANPADAFRTFNLLGDGMMEATSGLVGTAEATPAWRSAIALVIWPPMIFAGAWTALCRVKL